MEKIFSFLMISASTCKRKIDIQGKAMKIALAGQRRLDIFKVGDQLLDIPAASVNLV